jgi:hypothetical protein
MAQSLIITWTAPIPLPSCNYVVAYRAKDVASYTYVNTSGNTSGINSLSILGLLPACYEGFVESFCCKDSYSDATTSRWGVNTYQPLYPTISVLGSARTFSITLTAPYANPYAMLCSVFVAAYTVDTVTSFTATYSVTFPAGATSYTFTEFNGSIDPTTIITERYISPISPVFDNGGTLQQRDAVNTPQYFAFYNTSGCTSGTTSGCTAPTWNGSPIVLPSFTLDGFNVTAVDTMGNPIAGNLLVSWVQSGTFGGGSGIYHTITFQIFDSTGTTLQGTVTVPYGVAGLNNASIHILSTLGTITTGIQYLMKTLWADTSVSASQQFYLPTF